MALLTSGSTDSGTREGTLLALDSAMGLTGLSSLKWLQRCCSVTQLRILAVEEICRPLSEAEPSRSPFPSESTIDG